MSTIFDEFYESNFDGFDDEYENMIDVSEGMEEETDEFSNFSLRSRKWHAARRQEEERAALAAQQAQAQKAKEDADRLAQAEAEKRKQAEAQAQKLSEELNAKLRAREEAQKAQQAQADAMAQAQQSSPASSGGVTPAPDNKSKMMKYALFGGIGLVVVVGLVMVLKRN